MPSQAAAGWQLQGTKAAWCAGNTGTSWSDVLLGSLPNIYVYACNNPSETIVAKRRGYATIVSHNVPPYGRCKTPLHPQSPLLQLPVPLPT